MTTWANTNNSPVNRQAAWAAMAACSVMIAYHVGAKAVRDAFFLSQFDVTSLPLMVIVASLLSIGAVLGSARAISRFSPARVIPAAFAASAAMHAAIWWTAGPHPQAAAVALYLVSIAVGSILTSGFWAMLNERFDPVTAKSVVGRVAGAGTLGGMVSGLVAERVAAQASLTAMLPVLALYQLICGLLLLKLAAPPLTSAPRDQPEASGLEVVRQTPYLKTLAALVILGTISAAMIDYVFKSSALAEYGKGEQLLRFFALFYSVTGVLTFLVQTTLSRPLLANLGTARTVATLPFAVTVGGVVALLSTGLWTTTFARALETIFRGSLFRAGYEIFYMPMPVHEKRAAKGVIDVAFDRLGDAIGSGFVSLAILAGVTTLPALVLTTAVLVALAGLYVASRLEGAYINVLEHGMRDRAADVVAAAATPESLDLSMFGASMAMTSGSFDRLEPMGTAPAAAPNDAAVATPAPIVNVGGLAAEDPLLQQIATLRFGDRRAVRQAAPAAAEQPEAIPHLIRLLGRDDVCQPVMRALMPVAERHAGQLLDALLSEHTEFAVRRRIPRVLLGTPRQIVADGLLLGLNDRRFEVRFQCGLALADMASRNRLLRFSPAEIFGHIQKEVAVSKPVWESHRLLDQPEDAEGSPIFDEFLRKRTSRGLQHIFGLLSLVLPPDPLKLALQGLNLEDAHLRGTALEYLSSVLPRETRERLWPLIDDRGTPPPIDPRPREQVLAELMRADQTIYLRIEELRKRSPG